MENNQKKAMLFIDGDNIEAAYAARLIATAKENGYLAEIHLFANFTNIDGKGKSWDNFIDMYAMEAHHSPSLTEQKNSADIRLMLFLMSCLYERTDVDVYIIAANDNDYNPVVAEIRRFGKTAVNLYTDAKRSQRHLAVYNRSFLIESPVKPVGKLNLNTRQSLVRQPQKKQNNQRQEKQEEKQTGRKSSSQQPSNEKQAVSEKQSAIEKQAEHSLAEQSYASAEKVDTSREMEERNVMPDAMDQTQEGLDSEGITTGNFADLPEKTTDDANLYDGDDERKQAEERTEKSHGDDRYDKLVKTVKTLIERGLDGQESYSLSLLSDHLRNRMKKFSVKTSYKTRYSTFKKFLTALMSDYPEIFASYQIDMDVIKRK